MKKIPAISRSVLHSDPHLLRLCGFRITGPNGCPDELSDGFHSSALVVPLSRTGSLFLVHIIMQVIVLLTLEKLLQLRGFQVSKRCLLFARSIMNFQDIGR